MDIMEFLMYGSGVLFAASLILCAGTLWQRKKWHKALYVDELTGEYSHKRFCMEAQKWLDSSSNPKALIAFDLDGFKLINIAFGHRAGDVVLREVTSILKKHLHNKGIFARKYGDLFALMVQYETVDELKSLCEAIALDIMQIHIRHRQVFRITCSMGIYLVKPGETNLENMQNYAVLTRRSIKKQYNVYYRFYDPAMPANIVKNKHLMDKISLALQNHEFKPYYQPQYDAKTKKLIGAEALIRWEQPDGSIVMPGKFIPLSEIVGVIMYIDDYMFEDVCRQQHQWKKAGYHTLPISVNVSRHRLYGKEFIQKYVDILKKYRLECEDIPIEITEGTLFNAVEISEKLVSDLRNLGFSVLIDDFGMGYSSISMVKRFKASALKIDKSFVDDMSDEGKMMTTYIIDIAKLMHMQTVAEGVETKEQYEFLRDRGCDIIQGFYFAKPMPAQEFEKLLQHADTEL